MLIVLSLSLMSAPADEKDAAAQGLGMEMPVDVTDITNVPIEATAGEPLTLTGNIEPAAAATGKEIVWSISDEDDRSTGPTLAEGVLTAETPGTVIVTATVPQGLATGGNYTQDFKITVNDHADPYQGPGGENNTPEQDTVLWAVVAVATLVIVGVVFFLFFRSGP
ncbi:MAG: hypothetical protein FWG19_01410 [Methanomassiliicoccaceae archaeon]|nr:hypothetical protein [Methanomassiliicoccaceae archaeon]